MRGYEHVYALMPGKVNEKRPHTLYSEVGISMKWIKSGYSTGKLAPLLITALLLSCAPAMPGPAEASGVPAGRQSGTGTVQVRYNPQADSPQSLQATVVNPSGLQAALDQAQPGDTILIQSGTYDNLSLTITYSGAGPVAVRAEQPGSVIFTGKSLITIKDSENLIFSGFLFDQVTSDNSVVLYHSSNVHVTENYFYRNGMKPTSKIVAIRDGSANNHIHHNTFDRSRGQSVALFFSSRAVDNGNVYNKIYNNLFYNIPRVSSVYPGQTNGLEAIQVGNGLDFSHEAHTKIYDNLFEKVTGDGGEIISIKSSGNDIYRNTFLDNDSGLTFRLGNGNDVERNYFNNTKQGIRVFGYNQKVENNYLAGGTYGIQLPAADTATGAAPTVAAPYYQADGVKIEGNVIVGPAANGMLFGGSYSSTGRNLLPIHSEIKENRIYISGSAADYSKASNVASFYDPIADFSGNVSYLSSGANVGNITTGDSSVIEYVYTASPLIPAPEDVTGVQPFASKDTRTGAEWKIPADTSSEPEVNVLFDFEDFTPGGLSGQQGWTGNGAPNVTVTEYAYAVSGSQAVKVVDTDTTKAYSGIYTFEPIRRGYIEWWSKAINKDRLAFRMEDTTSATTRNVEWVGFFYDGTIEYQDGSVRKRTTETFHTDTWYRFRIGFDADTKMKTISIYEGENLFVEKETPFENGDAEAVNVFRFSTMSNRTGTFYVDDIRIVSEDE
ncbi:hypothetical protein FE783_07540 [Paenibacillus mesophilus]|nr:hypothetical protein FE783_07540 [Paenibacillus mesophilus]